MKIKMSISLILFFSNSLYADYSNISMSTTQQYMLDSQQLTNQNQKWVEAQNKAEQQRDVFRQVDNYWNSFPHVQSHTYSNLDIDVKAIAERYKNRQQSEAKSIDGILAFASLSMPKESLKKLIQDVTKIGGNVVFIGFKDNDYMSMAKAIKELNLYNGNIQINPNAFHHYKIKSIPSFVLVKAEAEKHLDYEGCVLPSHFSKITGDVSLEYALTIMSEKENSPDLKARAAQYLTQFKNTR